MKKLTSPLDPTCSVPVAVYQARGGQVINEEAFKQTLGIKTQSGLLELFPFGTKLYFSHPLQRRAEHVGESFSRFWWEPSGGHNSALFCGLVVGVRMLSVGESSPGKGYVSGASWPALVVQAHPFRKPSLV